MKVTDKCFKYVSKTYFQREMLKIVWGGFPKQFFDGWHNND